MHIRFPWFAMLVVLLLSLTVAASEVKSPEEDQRLNELEHAYFAEVIEGLDNRGRSADAALALLLAPQYFTPHDAEAGNVKAEIEARWQRVLADIEQVPVEMLASLASSAHASLDADGWSSYEEELLRRDGRNLASWMYGMDALADDPLELDRWLRRAVQHVDRFETFSYSAIGQLVATQAEHLVDPMLSARLQAMLNENTVEPWPRPATESELLLMPAFGRFMAIAIPSLRALAETCPRESDDLSRERRDLCQRLARHAMQGAGSLMDLALLVRIEENVAATEADKAQANEDRRRMRWLHSHQIIDMTPERVMQLSAYLDMPGASELGWVRRTMNQDGISLEPPADWQPATNWGAR